MLKIVLLLLCASTLVVAFPAIEPQNDVTRQLDRVQMEDRQTAFGFFNIMDALKQSVDRMLNKLVDETNNNFPELRQAFDDFVKAIRDWRLHKLTHKAVMKTLTAFTKGLYEARQQMASMEKLTGVVRWLDERVKGLCYLLSLYHEDCGYPDIDTVGGAR